MYCAHECALISVKNLALQDEKRLPVSGVSALLAIAANEKRRMVFAASDQGAVLIFSKEVQPRADQQLELLHKLREEGNNCITSLHVDVDGNWLVLPQIDSTHSGPEANGELHRCMSIQERLSDAIQVARLSPISCTTIKAMRCDF